MVKYIENKKCPHCGKSQTHPPVKSHIDKIEVVCIHCSSNYTVEVIKTSRFSL